MRVIIHVETQLGIAAGAAYEWAIAANVNLAEMRADDLLYAERDGQRLDIDEFLKLAPEFTREQLDEMARERRIDDLAARES